MSKVIDIIVATRNRYEKLMGLLNSIPKKVKAYDIHTHVICDGDSKTYNKLLNNSSIYRLDLSGTNIGSVLCRNELLEEITNNVIPAVDDMEFPEGSIEQAITDMENHYPDDDGVLGFKQTGSPNFHPAGMTMIGIKFLNRYPKNHLFCPEYFHFACQEIYWLAMKLNKFIQSKATIHHLSPFSNKKYFDQTHWDARKKNSEDHALMKDRKAKHLIWGE